MISRDQDQVAQRAREAAPPEPRVPLRRTLLILSGGLDSSVLLAQLLAWGDQVETLSVDYGQRHRRELVSASQVARHYKVSNTVADLSSLRPLLRGSSQTDDVPVPEGHYAEESMKATIVPNRNMILLSVAVGLALSSGCGTVAYAAHAGDHAIYPDCRPEFADALAKAIELCDWKRVNLTRPFVKLRKADIVSLGAALGVPFQLTWSCYKGGGPGARHCGRCGTCVERREAFELARVPDPTPYD